MLVVLGDDDTKNSIPVALAATGDLYWMAPLYLVSFCQIDVSKFPFDTQTCDIELSTWMLDDAVLSLQHSSEEIVLEEYTESGEFVIESTTTLKKDKLQLQYVNVKALVYRLVLRRRSTYYIVNLVLPVMLLQIPASSGEKLSFSLTMMLSLTCDDTYNVSAVLIKIKVKDIKRERERGERERRARGERGEREERERARESERSARAREKREREEEREASRERESERERGERDERARERWRARAREEENR
ncbi:hypothetical protein DPMN_160507 [Dreissena polymorpha]|uniref:Neurotransmitter-gated ion-channel ligand-binding domain-containing protein n=1 Tax=Dreissena polymorpha TaxID=45954 RepID=A0A9D4EMD5_DREPO|nr:hypothetical protein DPMN_160507 [Dreissena polymorpha]